MAVGDDPWNEMVNVIGEHSQTFKSGRLGLATGAVLGKKTQPSSYTVGTGPQLREFHQNVSEVTIENIDYRMTGGWGGRSWPSTNLFYFLNCGKVVLNNVNIFLDDNDFDTSRCIEFRSCQEVYVNNIQVIGAAWSDILRIIGCEYVLVQNSHIKGYDYGNGLRCARGINLYNGEAGDAGVYDIAFAVIQNNLVEDSRNHERTSFLGAIEATSPGNCLIFNNVIRNWIPHASDPIPFQVGHRRLPSHDGYGEGKRCRVARNIEDNPVPSEDTYNKLGSVFTSELDPLPDNIILWENNIFNDLKFAFDQKAGKDVFINNTFCHTSYTKQAIDIWNLRGNDAVTMRNNLFSYGTSNPGAFIKRTSHGDTDDKRPKLDLDYNVYHSEASPNFYEDAVNGSFSDLTLAAAQANGMEVNGRVVTSGAMFAALSKGTENFDYALHENSQAVGAGTAAYVSHSDPGLKVNTDFNGAVIAAPVDAGAFQRHLKATDDLMGGVNKNTGQVTLPFVVFTGNDIGTNKTITAVSSPVGCAVSISGTNILYQPNTDFVGNSTFVYTLSADEGTDTATVTIPVVDPATGAFNQDSGAEKIVSIETENYHNNVSGGAHSWVANAPTGASGGDALQANPDNGTLTMPTEGPYLEYRVNFLVSGTHYLWVRAMSVPEWFDSDSIYGGVNGAVDAGANYINAQKDLIGLNPVGEWKWLCVINWTDRATLNIPSATEHTINLMMREDGIIIDKLVLTTDVNYDPSTVNGGLGPAESSKEQTGVGGTGSLAAPPAVIIGAGKREAVSSGVLVSSASSLASVAVLSGTGNLISEPAQVMGLGEVQSKVIWNIEVGVNITWENA